MRFSSPATAVRVRDLPSEFSEFTRARRTCLVFSDLWPLCPFGPAARLGTMAP